ncbi:MAG: hypothetical protein ACE5WD_14855 [Candidatus Aminicenantia bacterium]
MKTKNIKKIEFDSHFQTLEITDENDKKFIIEAIVLLASKKKKVI